MEVALFPLNTVLFPGMTLPLNIFEERYKLMLKRCLEDASPFGVILIRRGEEVGGPAEPFQVGTLATIRKVEETDDGRFIVETVGSERFRIENQVHRFPYIRAEVLPFSLESTPSDERLAAEVGDLYEDFCRLALGLTGQWVRTVPYPREPAELASFVGPRLSSDNLAKQEILEAPSLSQQLELERDLLREEAGRLAGNLRSQQAQRWWSLSAVN